MIWLKLFAFTSVSVLFIAIIYIFLIWHKKKTEHIFLIDFFTDTLLHPEFYAVEDEQNDNIGESQFGMNRSENIMEHQIKFQKEQTAIQTVDML